MKLREIQPEFVEFIPRQLDEGVLYISERFQTASHKCACGCGEKVVTPLSPVEWRLSRDGPVVSLHPSIGNWNYACRSHYFIRNNRIHWAGQMSNKDISRVQAKDRADKEKHVRANNILKEQKKAQSPIQAPNTVVHSKSWIAKLLESIKRWLKGL
jgi:hypothetical protein